MLSANRHRNDYLLQGLAVLLLVVAALLALFWVKNLLIISLLAFVLSYFLAPFCNWLERSGRSRSTAVIVVYFGFTAVTLLILSIGLGPLSEQIKIFKSQWPNTQVALVHFIERFETFARSTTGLDQIDISPLISRYLRSWTLVLTQNMSEYLTSLLSICILTPLVSFFMLLDGRKIIRTLLSMVPQPLFESALNLAHQINHQLGGFVRARVIESLIISSVVLIGLSLINMPYVLFLALFAGVANLIPYLGPFIGAVPAFVALLSMPANAHVLSLDLMMVSVAGVYALAQLIDVFIIIPLVVARIVNLHPLLVVLSLIVGAQFMGILGMIVAIPAASICKLILQSVYQHLLQYRT